MATEDRTPIYICPEDATHDSFERTRIAYDVEWNDPFGEATNSDGEFFYPDEPVLCGDCGAVAIVTNEPVVTTTWTVDDIASKWACSPKEAHAWLKDHRYDFQEWLRQQGETWLAQNLPFPLRVKEPKDGN